MRSFFFWKSWPENFRYLWYILAILFGGAVLFLWYGYFTGNDNIIHWEKFQEQKILESVIHSFRLGPFTLSVPGENYVIFEYFNGSSLNPSATSSYIFLAVVVIAFLVLLTIVSTLERFWYLAGMTLFIVFIISLRLEVIGVFGFFNYYPTVAVLVLFTGMSFYFSMMRRDIQFLPRLLTFLGVAMVVAVIIWRFAAVDYPLLHLSVTSYTAALVLTVLFIMIVAHEILVSFIALTGQGNISSRNFNHFALITGIYLLNIILTCLHELQVIDWNFLYINLYLLLTISGVLAIWGFRIREPLYGNIFSFDPIGAYLIISLGAIAFVTTGNQLINGNDPALRLIRNMIIFSHAGFGIIFFTYILSNFAAMMWQNLPVYKILYKPNRMPYVTFQLAGFIATLAFIFYAGWRIQVYNGMAGFYNHLADLHVQLGNNAFALAHYEKAEDFAFYNHHANYALAAYKARRFAFEEAHRHYANANMVPSEYSLVNAGNLYLWENDVFGAIDAYRKATRSMPSGRLHNNLGYAFSKVHNVDSAIYHLSGAQETSAVVETAEANFFALAAAEYIALNADSILKTFDTKYEATVANALALSTLQQQPFTSDADPLKAAQLNLYTATLLNNYIVRNAKTLDTAFIQKAYRIASDSLNEDFSEALKLGLASAYYHKGNVRRALATMSELAYLSQSYGGKYNYIMGLWSLEQGNAFTASDYFDYAMLFDYKDAALYKAIALTEAGMLGQALAAWDSVARSEDEGERQIAAGIRRILNASFSEALTFGDAEKYQFCRYVLHVSDTLPFNRILPTFQNNNYRAMAILDMAKRQFAWDDLHKAIRYFNLVSGLQLTDQALYNAIRHFELIMLSERRELEKLATQINDGIDFGPDQQLEKLLYTAMIHEANGDSVNAERNYRILAEYNPYFEEGVIAAARFYRSYSDDPLKAYNILVEAIHINNNSVKLLKAYVAEALRNGFDEYAFGAQQQIEALHDRYR